MNDDGVGDVDIWVWVVGVFDYIVFGWYCL